MKLIKFKVKNYKTIDDSGWIDVDQIACLVGVNESGKTNIITALLKLNPADSSIKINPLNDYPRSNYSKDKNELSHFNFIEACFELEEPIEIKQEENSKTFKYIKACRDYSNTLKYYGIIDIDDLDSDENRLTTLENVEIPSFIYYASYASLDSELHLPTIINQM